MIRKWQDVYDEHYTAHEADPDMPVWSDISYAQDEIDACRVRIAELEAAIDKLAQCKGRFHTEANFKALIAVREKNLHK